VGLAVNPSRPPGRSAVWQWDFSAGQPDLPSQQARSIYIRRPARTCKLVQYLLFFHVPSCTCFSPLRGKDSIGNTPSKTLTKTEQKHPPEANFAEKLVTNLAAEIIWDRGQKIFQKFRIFLKNTLASFPQTIHNVLMILIHFWR
jgi:hypothetical protein